MRTTCFHCCELPALQQTHKHEANEERWKCNKSTICWGIGEQPGIKTAVKNWQLVRADDTSGMPILNVHPPLNFKDPSTYSCTYIYSMLCIVWCETEGKMRNDLYSQHLQTKFLRRNPTKFKWLRVYTVAPAVISVYHSKTEQMQNK